MGYSGQGSSVHVSAWSDWKNDYNFTKYVIFLKLDYVQRPSWQAQISGRKRWTLLPTPECEHKCTSFSVTVNKGEMSKLI